MRWRTLGIKVALAATLALGLVLGLIGSGAVASAQTTPTPAPASASSTLASQFLDKLAAALGIQRSALDSAIVSAGNATAADAVAAGRLTQAQADALTARVQAGEYGALFGGRGGHRGGERVEGLREAMVDAAAQELGITSDELRTALRSGQTVAELAAANNSTEQAVTDAALAAAKTKLDAAVAAGTITQAQADEIYARLQAEGLRLGGPGGRGGPRGDRQAPADSTTPAPTTSATDA